MYVDLQIDALREALHHVKQDNVRQTADKMRVCYTSVLWLNVLLLYICTEYDRVVMVFK